MIYYTFYYFFLRNNFLNNKKSNIIQIRSIIYSHNFVMLNTGLERKSLFMIFSSLSKYF